MCTQEPWSCCLPLEYVPGASGEARSEVQLRCEHGLLQELASRAFFRGLKARVPQDPPAMPEERGCYMVTGPRKTLG